MSRYVTLPEVVPNPLYRKKRFIVKLHEIGFYNECAVAVMSPLGDEFTRSELTLTVSQVRRETQPISHDFRRTLECIQWLADSNYEVQFPANLALSERIIFPISDNESNGIEDARFVRFTEDDGTVMYYATYTAYNGRAILPQLIETQDFLHFRILTLNGNAVQNKGMALFPRKVNGSYAMLSRQDDENLFIMFSDNPHHWNDPQILLRPAEPWETVKVGNCGSPIETEAGWLVITHGVGPMRKYCLGAALLDLNDPTKVIGRLREPLLSPEGNEREGYVPNVVYSCGSLIHGTELILPYAMSDKATAVASLSLKKLLAALTA
nr:glycoside hydrolase family 130 protein [Verrucomicrobium spinosum]